MASERGLPEPSLTARQSAASFPATSAAISSIIDWIRVEIYSPSNRSTCSSPSMARKSLTSAAGACSATREATIFRSFSGASGISRTMAARCAKSRQS